MGPVAGNSAREMTAKEGKIGQLSRPAFPPGHIPTVYDLRCRLEVTQQMVYQLQEVIQLLGQLQEVIRMLGAEKVNGAEMLMLINKLRQLGYQV